MKKPFILTSLLALTACGGGGGVVVNAPTNAASTPVLTAQTFAAGQGAVNSANASLTNMASYTATYNGTNENGVQGEIVDYVNSRLNNTRSFVNSNGRGASARSVTRDFDFATSDTKIANMKQVLIELAGKADDAAREQYISNHKNAVIEALVLYDRDQDTMINTDSTIEELIAEFSEQGLNADNVLDKMEDFDTDELKFTKEKLSEVRLNDSGTDAYFQFKMDDSGKITEVSLWESVTAEYGPSYSDYRIILNNDGTGATPDEVAAGGNLNPFDSEYINGTAGWLVRGTGNNSKKFTGTVYAYMFDFGERPEGFIKNYDNDDLIIYTDTPLDPDNPEDLAKAKELLKNKIIEKVNKDLHNQHGEEGGGRDDNTVDDFVTEATWYIQQINEFDSITNPLAISQVASMSGVGKTVNLRYSDFGYSSLARSWNEGGRSQTETKFVTYTGGYDTRRGGEFDSRTDKDNDPANPNLTNGATFTGTAIVSVEAEHEYRDQQGKSHDYVKSALYKDTGARLVYNITDNRDGTTTATHTLTMDDLRAQSGGDVAAGSKWYTTVITGTEGSDDLNFKFSTDGKTINQYHQFFTDVTPLGAVTVDNSDAVVNTHGGDNLVARDGGTVANDNINLHGSMSADYYGEVVTNPTEATSGFYFGERYHDDNDEVEHEVSVYGAFGGKK